MLLIGIVDILLDGVAQGCGQTGFALERFLSSSVRGSKGFSQLDRPQISLCDEIKNKPLSSSVRGSKGFSQLDRPRKSLCDEKQICCEANLTLKLKK